MPPLPSSFHATDTAIKEEEVFAYSSTVSFKIYRTKSNLALAESVLQSVLGYISPYFFTHVSFGEIPFWVETVGQKLKE